MPKWPLEFYCPKDSTQTEYRWVSGSRPLNIDQLLADAPPWPHEKQHDEANQDIPRVLIINDPTLYTPINSAYRERVRQKVMALLADGFTVLVPQVDQKIVVPADTLSQDQQYLIIHTQRIVDALIPASYQFIPITAQTQWDNFEIHPLLKPTDIQQAITHLGLTGNTFLELNYLDVRRFCPEKKTGYQAGYAIELCDFLNLPKALTHVIFESLLDSKYCTGIVMQEVKPQNAEVEISQDNIPNLQLAKNYLDHSFQIEYIKTLTKLIKKKNISHIKLIRVALEPASGQSLEQCLSDLFDTLSVTKCELEFLQFFIKNDQSLNFFTHERRMRYKNLFKNLLYFGCNPAWDETQHKFLIPLPEQIPQLRKLSFSVNHPYVGHGVYAGLVEASQTLKILEVPLLFLHAKSNPGFNPDKISFPHLEHLILTVGVGDDRNETVLLTQEKMPKLEKLTLKNMMDDDLDKMITYPSTAKIILSYSQPSATITLFNVMKSKIKFKSFTLHRFRMDNQAFLNSFRGYLTANTINWNDGFSDLKHLELSECDIPVDMLLSILDAAQTLETLNIDNYAGIPELRTKNETLKQYPLLAAALHNAVYEPEVVQSLTTQVFHEKRPIYFQQHASSATASQSASSSNFTPKLNDPGKVPAYTRTEQSSKKLYTSEIFTPLGNAPGLAPSNYRIIPYTDAIPATNSSHIQYVKHTSLQLQAPPSTLQRFYDQTTFSQALKTKALASDHFRYYGCSDPTTLTAGTPFPIPSTSGNETIPAIYLQGLGADQVIIKYSLVTRFYYLITHKTCQVIIHSAVDKPKIEPNIGMLAAISNLAQSYSLSNEDLDWKAHGHKSAAEIIEIIKQEKKGRCALRAIAFLKELRKKYPSIVAQLMAVPGLHEYIEIIADNHSQILDVGGIHTEVEIKRSQNRINLDKISETPSTIAPQLAAGPVIENKMSASLLTPTAISIPIKILSAPSLDQSYNIAGLTRDAPVITTFEQLIALRKKIFSAQGKNHRMICENPEQLSLLSLVLQQQSQQTFFFIDKPEQLRCLGKHTQFAVSQGQDNIGSVIEGLGGPLYQFLVADPDAKKCIIIDYRKFTAKQVVKYNSILGRTLNGIALPGSPTLIALCTPETYAEDDFTTRCEPKQTIHLAPSEFAKIADPAQIKPTPDDVQNAEIIDLFDDSEQWEGLLLGHWQLHGKQLSFSVGKLIQALSDKKTHIVLKNAPWKNLEFQNFIRRILQDKKFHLYNRLYKIDTLIFSRAEGYDWPQLFQEHTAIVTSSVPSAPDFILNPSSQGYLFNDYEYHLQEKNICVLDGFLLKHQNKSVTIYVSRTIKPNMLAKLLSIARENNVKIHFKLAQDVEFPKQITVTKNDETDLLPSVFSLATLTLKAKNGQLIRSTDMELTCDLLDEKFHIDMRVDISDRTGCDLLIERSGTYQNNTFEFNEKVSGIWQALLDGKTVLLKGHLSTELEDALLPLCTSPGFIYYNGQKKYSPGTLIIVTDSQNKLNTVPATMHHVSTQEKCDQIPNLYPSLQKIATDHSYLQLKTLQAFLQNNPKANIHDHWQGLENLPARMIYTDMSLDIKIANAYTQECLDLIESKLAYSPYVFIVGETGVGKSTFIDKHYNHRSDMIYYHGTEKLPVIAADKRKIRKRIFVDEADIGLENWHFIKDSLNNIPSIYINGDYHALDNDTQFIFAGNPLSYGGERIVPDLFKQAGACVIFKAPPPAYLYHEILLPLLKDVDNHQTIAIIFLKAYYQKINETQNTIALTPRDLQLMVLLFLAHQADDRDAALKNAENCAILVIDKVLPMPEFVEYLQDDFIVTKAHQQVKQHVRAMLQVGNYKCNTQNPILEKTPGINLYLLEGVSGIGKSTVICKALAEMGLGDQPLNSAENNQGKIGYYLIEAGADTTVKEALLRLAYAEDRPIVFDEINTGEPMEKTCNELLMGNKPNFKIFATQNSAYQAGRELASLAQQRRAFTYMIPDYNAKQIESILLKKSCPQILAKILADIYVYRHHDKRLKDYNLRKLLQLVKNFQAREPQTIACIVALHPDCAQYICSTTSRNLDEFNQLIASLASSTLSIQNIVMLFNCINQQLQAALMAQPRWQPSIRAQNFYGESRWSEVIEFLKSKVNLDDPTLTLAELKSLEKLLHTQTSPVGILANYLYGRKTTSGAQLDTLIEEKVKLELESSLTSSIK